MIVVVQEDAVRLRERLERVLERAVSLQKQRWEAEDWLTRTGDVAPLRPLSKNWLVFEHRKGMGHGGWFMGTAKALDYEDVEPSAAGEAILHRWVRIDDRGRLIQRLRDRINDILSTMLADAVRQTEKGMTCRTCRNFIPVRESVGGRCSLDDSKWYWHSDDGCTRWLVREGHHADWRHVSKST
jgi:hypothetical protein